MIFFVFDIKTFSKYYNKFSHRILLENQKIVFIIGILLSEFKNTVVFFLKNFKIKSIGLIMIKKALKVEKICHLFWRFYPNDREMIIFNIHSADTFTNFTASHNTDMLSYGYFNQVLRCCFSKTICKHTKNSY